VTGPRLAVGFSLAVLMAACQLPGAGIGCTAQIDWVDFVQVGAVQYVAGPGSPATVQQAQLGKVVSRVKFRVSRKVCDPNYRPKDGDAAFLDPGTAIYEVAGYPSTEVVAASHDGNFVRYEVKAPGS
jgi:hypothetical protein